MAPRAKASSKTLMKLTPDVQSFSSECRGVGGITLNSGKLYELGFTDNEDSLRAGGGGMIGP